MYQKELINIALINLYRIARELPKNPQAFKHSILPRSNSSISRHFLLKQISTNDNDKGYLIRLKFSKHAFSKGTKVTKMYVFQPFLWEAAKRIRLFFSAWPLRPPPLLSSLVATFFWGIFFSRASKKVIFS